MANIVTPTRTPVPKPARSQHDHRRRQSGPSEPAKSISLSKVLASVPSVVPKDCGLRAGVMLSTDMPENSAIVTDGSCIH